MAELPGFADFVHGHSRSLLGTAYLLTGDIPTAEDLVQDTLTELLPKWSQVTAADSSVAYVRKTPINTIWTLVGAGSSPTFARD